MAEVNCDLCPHDVTQFFINGSSIQRRLGTPSQTDEIRVFPLNGRATIQLVSLALGAPLFLLPLLLVTCSFAIPFAAGCFPWSSHDVLLPIHRLKPSRSGLRAIAWIQPPWERTAEMLSSFSEGTNRHPSMSLS